MRYSVFANNIMQGVYSRRELREALTEAMAKDGYVFDWWHWRPVSDEEALAAMEKKHAAAVALFKDKRRRPRLAVGT